MAFDVKAIEAALPQEHKDALAANNSSVPAVIAWFEKVAAAFGQTVCAIEPLILVIVNHLPNLNALEKAAITAVLSAVCPAPTPTPPAPATE